MTGMFALTMSPISCASEKRAGATTWGLEWRWVTNGPHDRAAGDGRLHLAAVVTGQGAHRRDRSPLRHGLGIGALAHAARGGLERPRPRLAS